MGFFEKLFGAVGEKHDFKQMMADGAVVIDVRTPQEFEAGNVPNSINIPLNQVQHKVNKFKSIKKPIILCCASGNRSGQATSFLKSQGINEVYNGGGWRRLI